MTDDARLPPDDAFPHRLLFRFALVLFSWLFVMHAWMVDDAYFTLRQVDNLVRGLGLRFNPAERVQGYTHPLWMMLLTPFHAVTREAFYTPLAVSYLVDVAGLVVAARWLDRAAPPGRKLLMAALLFSSKAFMDYTSSGLENPLTHLLLFAFFGRLLARPGGWRDADERELLPMFTLASLAFVNRSDTVAFYVLPGAWLLASAWPRMRLRLLRPALLGALPAALWTAFSLFYYGAPFPNTVYAKVTGARVGFAERAGVGGLYVLDSLANDPLTLPLCLAACALVLHRRPAGPWREALRSPAAWAALGLLSYVAYVVLFGAAGTHMSGRFFSGVGALAALVAASEARGRYETGALAVAAVLVALFAPTSPYRAGLPSYQAVAGNGWGPVALDTRFVVRGEGAALLSARRGAVMPDHHWYREGLAMRGAAERYHIGVAVPGYSTYAAGPEHHWVDPLALTEPLLARIPPSAREPWAPGHVARAIPDGYAESVRQGRNLVTDPALHEYYEAIRLITRGPLLSGARLGAVWKLNTGGYDHLMRDYALRHGLRW